MKRIDGNEIAESILLELQDEVEGLPKDNRPKVAFIRVGEDPASVSYVRKKQKTAERIGVTSELFLFPEDITEVALHDEIDRLNADDSVHGILVQSPLPPHLSDQAAFEKVDPLKDVDGFHGTNLGKLCREDPSGFVACTPSGVLELLDRSGIDIPGKHVVIIGRSLIVGKPLALLFLRRQRLGDATVTVCHSKTPNLGDITRSADILVAAVGRPEMVRGSMIKPGACVIDVGINRIADATRKSGYRLVGDVHFEEASQVASHLTPVPGGVGPLTVAMLMKNTLQAYRYSQKKEI